MVQQKWISMGKWVRKNGYMWPMVICDHIFSVIDEAETIISKKEEMGRGSPDSCTKSSCACMVPTPIGSYTPFHSSLYDIVFCVLESHRHLALSLLQGQYSAYNFPCQHFTHNVTIIGAWLRADADGRSFTTGHYQSLFFADYNRRSQGLPWPYDYIGAS